MIRLAFFTIFLLNCLCAAVLFRWLPSNAFSDPKNWLPSGSVPCADDNVRLDAGNGAPADQNIVVAQLDGPLRVNIVTFPTNGILYFGAGDTEFGSAFHEPTWQCAKRDQPEDAIFSPRNNEPNFFDFANWQILSDNTAQVPSSLLRLDAERVPSDEDVVLFPDDATSKVFIDISARVKAFNMSGQSLLSSNLRQMLRTVEGQFRFRMGARISTEMDSVDQLQLRWPSDTVFTVDDDDDDDDTKGQPQKRRAEIFGRPNSNFAEPRFSSLCGFVHCVPTGPYCANAVQAVGQCCPQCGAMLRFRKTALNFSLAFAVVDEAVRAQIELPRGAGVSFVRVDRDDVHPLYQISVLPNHPENFVESTYCSVMWSVFRKIQQRTINAHLPIEYQPKDSADFFDVRPTCSIQLGILHWKTVFKAFGFITLVGIVLCVMVQAHYRQSRSFRLFVADLLSRQRHSVQVIWHRAQEGVEVIREETEEEENDGANANGGGVGASFLAEFSNRAFSSKMENQENEAVEEAAAQPKNALPEEKLQPEE